jgi:CheY-like chemotaxis protein
LKVLIVDDNASVRRLIRSVLPALASEIYECANGADALITYQARRPDVVLMDIRMDEMDGIQATERIKAADQGARILIVTDYDDEELHRAPMRAGACGYVLKYNLLALVQLLEPMEQALRERRTGSTEH